MDLLPSQKNQKSFAVKGDNKLLLAHNKTHILTFLPTKYKILAKNILPMALDFVNVTNPKALWRSIVLIVGLYGCALHQKPLPTPMQKIADIGVVMPCTIGKDCFVMLTKEL